MLDRSLIIGVLLGACGGGGAAPDAAPDAPAPDAYTGPRLLSSTGLYDPSGGIVAGVREFAPRYVLWSDGAVKRRWLYLPPGTQLDTSDPAHWQLPVGGKLWKQFADPAGPLLETRLIERVAATGDDDQDYWTGAFVWRDDESDAVFAADGAQDVRGTDHDVPTSTQCRTCHTGEPGFMLGVSALQLSGAGTGTRLDDLASDGVLSAPVADYTVPGDATTQAALGYLHANCGHCHNPSGAAWPDVPMTLQLDLTAATPETTTIWQSTVGVPLFRFMHLGYTDRIVAGDPDTSAIVYRMSVRDAGTTGAPDQMPPLATEHVDDVGVAAVRAWITSIPP